ncbi:MAG: translation initiation factor IF-2 [Ignavibacteria bacterium]|nr:translation initiation factor IF-2 [Ignavibacteria bacterium]
MADAAIKKVKIYKLATELNLSSETIIEFLRKKGFEVKSHMTVVTEEMMQLLMAHFKKEKDSAERHQRKVREFRSSRKKETAGKDEKGEIEEIPVREVAAEAVVKEPLDRAEVLEPSTTSDTAIAEGEMPAVAEGAIMGESEDTEIAVAGEVTARDSGIEPEATIAGRTDAAPKKTGAREAAPKEPKPKGKRSESPLEKAVSRAPRGLKIKGKLDLQKTTEETPGEPEEKKKKKKKKKVVEDSRKQKPDVAAPEETQRTRKRKKSRHAEVDEAEVERAIRTTLAGIGDESAATRASHRKKKRLERAFEEQRIQEELEREKTIVRVTEFVSVGELANLMRVSVAEVIQKCMALGMMVSINQRLDRDTITLVSDEFGYQVNFEQEFAPEILDDHTDDEQSLQPRPPVVTIMGHVDHGKTSLLDYIRQSNVVAGESGGITQHIGAYEVTLDDGKQITFLDTPGHEAFTAMRARGAQVTDLVVLVVASDDNVMPQTVEAISHAQAASVSIIIAMNKIDRADSNPERIRQQLSEKGVLVEEWGGKYQSVELSAKTGLNVDQLLEKILLEAEILNLRANPIRPARGIVIEAELDKGKGIVVSVLVQKGTLRTGDGFVCGMFSGRVRAMFDERGNRIEAAKPSQPVQVIGFDGIPQAGDVLVVMSDERDARDISLKRQQLKREQDFRQRRLITLDDISSRIKEGQLRELPVIVKGDVDGSVEALSDSLMRLSTAEVGVVVVHKGVGGISESDVLLAAASGAVIIGFHVRPNLNARRLAEQESVDIRLYDIIYDAINEIRSALEGMLAPSVSEEILSTVEVREVFKMSRVGTIAGCYVKDGKIVRNAKVRLIRDGLVVFTGSIGSLRRFKDDVREVDQGFECGITLDGFNDIKLGDIIETFKMVETKRKL